MRALPSLAGLLDAPKLKELVIAKRVGITDDDVARINRHRSLERFLWSTEDVPRSIASPILEQIQLPPARSLHAIDWFRARKR